MASSASDRDAHIRVLTRELDRVGLAADDRFGEVAELLVNAGRVVPGLTFDDHTGLGRSWWWPLPAASQRSLVASLVDDASIEGQRDAATRLGEAVDGIVRGRLVAARAQVGVRRSGRLTVSQAWCLSLVSADPWLSASADPAKVAALSEAVAAWVRSGAVIPGRVRLCLRIVEPATANSGGSLPGRAKAQPLWQVELLAQDQDEPSLIAPLADLWAGESPFAPSAIADVLGGLARMARLAPELAGVLEEAKPDSVHVDSASVVALLAERAKLLEDAGIAVLAPGWWSRPARLGLRAKLKRARSHDSAGAGSGLVGMDSIVDFEWQAALGERRLTKADLAALERGAKAKQELVRLRGQWVRIDVESIGRLLAKVGEESSAEARDLLKAGLGLGDLDLAAGLEVLDVDATSVGWMRTLLDGALHATVEAVPTPPGFDGQLRPYQERGVGWLAFLGRLGLGACLADDMGLGKTAQLIAAMIADPAGGPTLVVCPVSVLGNWERELARFAPSLRVLVHHGGARNAGDVALAERAADVDVVVSTYSLLARDREALEGVEWARLVFDEAQQLKNPSAAQTRAAASLKAGRRVALTGTPVENRLSELWSIMHLLNPGLLGAARVFKERFAVPIEREGDAEATALLRRVTGPFVLRRLKTDRSIIADLPDKIETVDRCPLTKEQATLYQAVVDDMLAQADASDGIQRRGVVLAGLSKLKQVCNHPAHFLSDGSALAGRSGKLSRTEELLDEILDAGDKVLCFTQFSEWGGLLAPYFQRRFGVETLWLHGRVRRPVRDDMVRRFSAADGPPLFLISLKAGGTGLNLTAASHVIHLDRWWNPAVEDQATDRAFRIGQRRNVQVHKLVSSGTVEERIDEMITAKRDLAARAVGTGEEWLTGLSGSELRDLVSLSAQAVAD
ncbi:MAG: DEAD/DEAH box helicase [Acidimicrobiales bacterium]